MNENEKLILSVQDYLRTNGLEKFQEEYAVKARFGVEFPHLVCLNYDQIDTPNSAKITWPCRGMIMDSITWDFVTVPYVRFFNYGESFAANVDWSTAHVYNKLDGSLIVLYFFDGKWRVQTRGTVEAGGDVQSLPGTSFADVFWKTWNDLGYQLPVDEDINYIFEFMSPYNRVVVRHEKPRIVLHGVRNRVTLEETSPMVSAKQFGWECVESFPLKTLDDILAASEKLDPMEAEGYVIADANFNRIKVKSPAYVAIAHMIGQEQRLSVRSMLTIVMKGESDEWLSYYPEWTKAFIYIMRQYEHFLGELEGSWTVLKELDKHLIDDWDVLEDGTKIDARKAFAILAKVTKHPGTMFTMLDSKAMSVAHYLKTLNVKALEKIMKLKDVDMDKLI